jgi:hypothetical protein
MGCGDQLHYMGTVAPQIRYLKPSGYLRDPSYIKSVPFAGQYEGGLPTSSE